MIRYDRPAQALAAGLAAIAGYVDATGFIKLGGFFVSFMSGNSTRMGIGIVGDSGHALIAGSLIGTFILGVMAGSFTRHFAGAHGRPAVLILVATLLAAAAALHTVAAPRVAIAAMALAMGAENAVFERDGDVHIGLTYMTGTLVKFGQRVVAACLGGDRLAWMPYLSLWLSLVAGAVMGAAAYPYLGLGGLWIAALAAAVLALVSARIGSGE